MSHLIAYGPVPSRRLGQSIGINHIPPKNCTYSCVYCQLGNTIKMRSKRTKFYPLKKVLTQVKLHVKKAMSLGENIDYITFVPDGEPTLDVNLGKEIRLLKPFGIKTAVIQNSSLLWREDVRNDLFEADWVSCKIDAVSVENWRRIDRPHKDLELEIILDGLKEFAREYKGVLTSETMLIKSYNDGVNEVKKIANFLEKVKPDIAYISIPTRPPAEDWVESADEVALNQAFQIFNEKLNHVEHLIGYEGDSFAFTGDVENDLLSITSVHPMRKEGVDHLLSKANSGWEIVTNLIREKKLIELNYLGNKFYMRKLPSRSR